MPPKKSVVKKTVTKKQIESKKQDDDFDQDLTDVSDDESVIGGKNDDNFEQNNDGEWGDGDENNDDGEDVDLDADDADDVDDDDDEEIDLDANDDDGDGDDDCSYDGGKKSKKKIGIIDKEDDGDDFDNVNIDENELKTDIYVKTEDRRTSPYLFSYERVRLLGDRTAQLAQGAKPMIKGVNGMTPRDIALIELEKKIIPLKIIRPLPNGKKEMWSLDELRYKKEAIV